MAKKRGVDKKARQNQKDFYNKTQVNANAPQRGSNQKVTKKSTVGPTPTWHYWAPTFAVPIVSWFVLVGLIQYMLMTLHNIPRDRPKVGFFYASGFMPVYMILLFVVMPIFGYWVYRKTHATWFNNNAMYLSEDIEEHTNDAYIRTLDHIVQELEAAPDVGMGWDGHASTLMGHAFISNKGIDKIDMPQRDMNVDGYVKRDENGEIVTKMVPMFNPELAELLFTMSGVPIEHRTLYDATDYDYNRKLTKKEGGGKDKDGKYKRAGTYDRAHYDTLADYINNEFYPLDTETERPSGVYFYDKRPVNTILIAITRGGKGQTYIEPAFDVWTREKKKWNIFTTDPKGELLAKFYYSATIRGYDIVQFNLMHPHLTNVYNPLANAIQAFRQNNPVKGSTLIDSIVDTLFPDNGEIWNPAAGNMFRRAVYLLFDYYIEQENYIRYIGHKNNTAQEIIDQQINDTYSKVTMYNVYSVIGELAAKVSKDVQLINIDPKLPPVNEKDLLTLIFDAMSMLPANDLRTKAITANNAIKQIAGAQQTIAGIYATLLTGLSVYADDTTIALMSGSLSESFDVGGLGFPRRVGVHFDGAYVKKFRITKELCRWSIYRDKDFTDKYEGDAYMHEERLASSNWVWGYFEGIFDQQDTYIKLEILTSGGDEAETFYFKFSKGYKRYDNITYVIDKITKQKIISGGTLVELDPRTKDPKVSEFMHTQIDIMSNGYKEVSKPVITSNQVFYSERPKFIFAITPPHLQVYQKHILIIIKQILDEQYSNSYVIKPSRKPIIGTRLMLEEFGNIRSGENGIPNIDTATSIALGQDVQITFVLQSFQQLRAVYGEDVEKIIRANSSNTIFLKSNDEELVNELVRLSGTRHEFRVKSKSVSRKVGDMITVSEPVINYSGENTETTALTSNDLLFLAGPSPGNSVTFSSGEMPIVGKLSTITPMAAGLHKHLPQPVGGQYSDATMPSTNTNDAINFLDNIIDGEALVMARVAQARIWIGGVDNTRKPLKDRVFEIAEREGVSLNERDGSLAELVMNTIYDIYEKEDGQTRNVNAEPVQYWKMAKTMFADVKLISDKTQSQEQRLEAVSRLRENLTRCAMDNELDELTALYRDTTPTTQVNVGYDQVAVSKFVVQFQRKYPQPDKMKLDTQNVFDQAKSIDGYTEYTGNVEVLFDTLNYNHTTALEDIIEDIINKDIDEPAGVGIDMLDGANNEATYRVTVGDVYIMDYVDTDYDHNVIYNPDNNAVTQAVTSNAVLIQLIQSHLKDAM